MSRLSFPLTVKLLGFDEYCYNTLLGLCVSVGGLTESLVREREREREERERERERGERGSDLYPIGTLLQYQCAKLP